MLGNIQEADHSIPTKNGKKKQLILRRQNNLDIKTDKTTRKKTLKSTFSGTCIQELRTHIQPDSTINKKKSLSG